MTKENIIEELKIKRVALDGNYDQKEYWELQTIEQLARRYFNITDKELASIYREARENYELYL